MTIIEEKAYLNEISRLAGKVSYLEGLLYKFRKMRKKLLDVTDKFYYPSEANESYMRGIRNALSFWPKEAIADELAELEEQRKEAK
jgi:hypothetical protein